MSISVDVLKLASGTAIAQFFAVLASPVLARLYGPEAFGLWALFTSITSIIGVIVCMRYEMAIILPKSDVEAANLLGVSLIISVVTSLFVILVIWLIGDSFLNYLNAPGLAPYVWLVPLAVFFGGIFTTLNHWNSRTRKYGRLAVVQAMGAGSTTLAQICIGVTGFASGGGLICASVGGKVLASTVLWRKVWKDDKELLLKSVRWQAMMSEAKRHRKFPVYGACSGLINTVSWQLPTFLLATFFSSTVVGYYALSFRILQLPMSIVGQAIGKVFFQRAAEAKIQGNLASLVENTFRSLVAVGMFPMLMLAVVGENVSVIFFGREWAEAGIYLQILSIWTFFWFVSSPLSTFYNIIGQQKFVLKFNTILFVSRLCALTFGGLVVDARLAIFLFSLTGIFLYGYLSLNIIKKANVDFIIIFKVITYNFFISTMFVLPVFIFSLFCNDDFLVLCVSIFLFVTYGFFLKKKLQINT